jgi:hypothetical protein
MAHSITWRKDSYKTGSPSRNNTSEYQTLMPMTPSYQNRQIRLFLPFQDLKV